MRYYPAIRYSSYERFRPGRILDLDMASIKAEDSGKLCPQRSSRLDAMLGGGSRLCVEEGSLYLSISAPDSGEGLPVMVWIHGGAFLTGGSGENRYGAERLVDTGNVIVVKISYRLGFEGYLYMPEEGCVNLGLEDQKNALNWVHNNIAAFGGDPDNITVFGQSAGALSVCDLLCDKDRVFNKAIIQSAPLGIRMSERRARKTAKEFRKLVGEDISSAPLESLLDAQAALAAKTIGGMPFQPVGDFRDIPDADKLRVVAGWAREDASPFVPRKLGRGFIRLASNLIFRNPTRRFLGNLAGKGASTDSYCIKWYPEGNCGYYSCHCIELPFLLGRYEDWKEAKMLRGMGPGEYEKNSRLLLGAWTEFSKSGMWDLTSSSRDDSSPQEFFL